MFHTDKAFICEICAKAFRFRSNLAEHRSVHTALKPYVCKFCGKSSRLKGNLTKHILKHHKKEQNAYIGKDDIIIKKGKKSVKDPAAVDFLEKSMIVLTTATTATSSSPSDNPISFIRPKDENLDDESDNNRSFLLSLGLDPGSMDLRSHSPDEPNLSIIDRHRKDGMFVRNDAKGANIDDEPGMESNDDSEIRNGELLHSSTTISHMNSKILNRSDFAQRTAPLMINHLLNRTQCMECGKHFRKGSSLQVHMTLNHGFPPPLGTSSSRNDSVGKSSDYTASTLTDQANGCVESNTTLIQQELAEIKAKIDEMRSANHSAIKAEQILSGLDTRIGRLEKQLELALNSIYTIVQLQTGINSSVTRFKDEISEQLKSIRSILGESSA